MRNIAHLLTVSVALTLVAHVGALAQGADKPWTIKASMKSQVEGFVQNSDTVKEMHALKLPNAMVYSVDALHGPLLPVYDLLACLHLTQPKSKMAVDSGGGYDISMQSVQFPGGVWDVNMRLREVQQINLLESQNVYMLDRIIIGTLRMNKTDQKVRAVRQLSQACFAVPVKK